MTRLLLAALALGASVAHAAGAAPLWTASGLANPESALYSTQQKVLYVSNINGEPNAKDGNGFISQLALDGKPIKREWLKGLNAPKGLGYYFGLLYIADLDELLEVDTGNGRIKRRLKAPGSKGLDDVAVTSNGTVFVSEQDGNTIWRLQGDSFAPWLRDPALEGPKGLLFEKGQLLVASFGVPKADGQGAETSYVKTVDIATKAISARFLPIPLGNLDGLASDGKGGTVVSDFTRGNVFRIGADGQPNLWLQLTPGTADLGTAPGLLLVPHRLENTLSAYALK